MASFATSSTFTAIPATTATTTTTTKRLPNSPLFSTSHQRSKKIHRNFKVSCNIADNNEKRLESENLTLLERHNLDRRNLLLGLGAGGLYTTVNLPAALAAPITTPDISTCKASVDGFFNLKDRVRTNACCPPLPPPTVKSVKKHVLPKCEPVRLRPAAHRVTPEYLDKYQRAMAAMRALPDEDPHSFVQQAKIHCAYCNGGYFQEGYPNKELQVHNCWLFFPFHRWYLYFFERILGKLIDDPTFGLPYWNWDNPSGMSMPAFFEGKILDPNTRELNPAFDAFRNVEHLPPAILDIDFNNAASADFTCVQQIGSNLSLMYKQMITNSPNSATFFGGEYKAGDDPISLQNSKGPIESGVHTAAHIWVGNPRMPNNEDMGNFYSSGWDPLFYTHHANVDRMWKIWKDLKGPEYPDHTEPTDPDWLDASYVFYDENKELVRVYNKDCVQMENLHYEYEPSPLPWLKSRPIGRNKNSNVVPKSFGNVKKVEETKFPVKLDKIVKVLVKRPTINRSKEDKKKAYELLYVNDIKLDGEKFVKFDVFVNDVDDGTPCSPLDSEFAGSFSQLAHYHGNKMLMSSGVTFGLNELLDDIQAESDEYILVTLVPRTGCEDVTVGVIKVELVPSTASG
ncbi:hypothetical protein L6452_00508 [Arctium lappa]|uniref:Uncharacterized protein n=1 Tax=Arctium lappa TaxID=4217 RepID=A0ACB9FFD9_ARCLA|nr:hypothetical protein L6452_00508 [Arctium lappa]